MYGRSRVICGAIIRYNVPRCICCRTKSFLFLRLKETERIKYKNRTKIAILLQWDIGCELRALSTVLCFIASSG